MKKVMSKRGIVICMFLLPIMSGFSMQKNSLLSAYVISRSCNLCGVDGPPIPQIRIAEFDCKRGSVLSGDKELHVCIHSSLGPFDCVGKKSTKKRRYISGSKIYYQGPLEDEYVVDPDEVFNTSYPRFNVKKCLFTGNNFLDNDDSISEEAAQKLCDFFSVVMRHKCDINDLLVRRWSHEFVSRVCWKACGVNTSLINSDKEFKCACDMFENKPVISAFALNSAGLIAVTGFARKQKNLFLWDMCNNSVIPLEGHSDAIKSVQFSCYQDIIISTCAGSGNNCILWDGETGDIKNYIENDYSNISKVAISRDASLVALAGIKNDEQMIGIWSGYRGNNLISCSIDIPYLDSLEFSHDNNWLIGKVAAGEQQVLLWRIDILEQRLMQIAHYGDISAIAFDYINERMVISNYQGNIYLLSTRTGDCLKSGIMMHKVVRALAFDPDGRAVVLAGVHNNGTIFFCWKFIANRMKDFFYVPSVDGISSTKFSSITFSDDSQKLLLGTSNSFVFGDWIKLRLR